MADRLAGRTDSWASLGARRSGHGGREPAKAATGRTSQGGRADAHAGRRQHRGGNRLGGGGPSAQRPEGGCLPCQGGAQLAWRHWEDGWGRMAVRAGLWYGGRGLLHVGKAVTCRQG